MNRRDLFKTFLVAPIVGVVSRLIPKPVVPPVSMAPLPDNVAPFVTMMTRKLTETECGVLRSYGFEETQEVYNLRRAKMLELKCKLVR